MPRKIFSVHIILICIFLLLPQLRRLTNMFLLNRPVEPEREVPLFANAQWNRLVVIFQIGFGIVALGLGSLQARQDENLFKTHLGPATRGIWYVDDFVLDNVSHPPLATDNTRWQHVVLDSPYMIDLQLMDNSVQHYGLRLDEQQRKLMFTDWQSQRWKGSFIYDYSQPDVITLTGQLDGRPLTARLRRLDLSDPNKFVLTNRGFHWINPSMFRR